MFREMLKHPKVSGDQRNGMHVLSERQAKNAPSFAEQATGSIPA